MSSCRGTHPWRSSYEVTDGWKALLIDVLVEVLPARP